MTSLLARVAITGAGGRLGTALIDALADRQGTEVLAWRRPEYDLDAPEPERLLDRDRPSIVVDAAAWTDVDGCARSPALAMRRNAEAAGRLARACAARGVALVLVSTAEVFDGARGDGLSYRETDATRPRNPYGASKQAAEQLAREAFGTAAGLWIMRTGWLFGAPGNDFPEKIIAAADRLAAAERLPVVADETGSPTYSRDLARALLELVAANEGGVFHVANQGTATRYEWADAVLGRCRPGRALRPILQTEFQRASTPPRWAVLDGRKLAELGIELRDWRLALADYLGVLCPGAGRSRDNSSASD